MCDSAQFLEGHEVGCLIKIKKETYTYLKHVLGVLLWGEKKNGPVLKHFVPLEMSGSNIKSKS